MSQKDNIYMSAFIAANFKGRELKIKIKCIELYFNKFKNKILN